MNIVLIGMRGVGKTNIARRVCFLTKRPVMSTDVLVEYEVGLPIPELVAQQGWPAVILVGDEPYYGPLGFKRIPRGQVSMPRPVDLDRVLAVEITPGAVARLTGMIDHEDRMR